MTIKATYSGLEAVNLMTANGAMAHATYNNGERTFAVSLSGAAEHARQKKDYSCRVWHFDEPACREAIEFFTKLADDLKQRGGVKG